MKLNLYYIFYKLFKLLQHQILYNKCLNHVKSIYKKMYAVKNN